MSSVFHQESTLILHMNKEGMQFNSVQLFTVIKGAG